MESWGRHPKVAHRELVPLRSRSEPLPRVEGSLLPHGLGRSYGDSCLNEGGTLLLTRGLDRFMALDRGTGMLACEAGTSLEEIIALALPLGFFLPVTPGTKHVTVGGAIANDVHGKNHHRAGSFGNHVVRLELVRSDGRRIACSRDQESDLFRATIGGLGLTGLVTWAEIRLARVPGPWIDQETVKFRGIAEFLELEREAGSRFECSVGWIDCAATGRSFARGLLMRGNASAGPPGARDPGPRRARLAVPFELPVTPLNRWTVRAFNALYDARQIRKRTRAIVHHDVFYYPLDAIGRWNRIYGPRGFLQHQCVVPDDEGGRRVLESILRRVAERGWGSPLAVIKRFGPIPSEGLLSFPREGITLALDFPVGRPGLFGLLDELDRDIVGAGGAVYPGKDARMSRATFEASFPALPRFLPHVDPGFSSSFWRRVMEA